MTLRPMLADKIEPGTIHSYLTNNEWVAQNKYDGQRYLVIVENGEIKVLNRAGVPKASNLSYGVLAEFERVAKAGGSWCFDGEYLEGDRLVLFDLPQAGSLIGLDTPFEERFQALQLLCNEWHPNPQRIVVAGCAETTDEKLNLVHVAQEEHREGIMFRHRNGVYMPAHRSRQLLKAKFTRTIDVIITELAREGKENAVISVLDPDHDRVLELGTVSAIGKKPTPEPGQVWEVEYLYVLDPANPRLYQPRLKVIRTDKGFTECLADQLADSWTDKSYTTRTRKEM